MGKDSLSVRNLEDGGKRGRERAGDSLRVRASPRHSADAHAGAPPGTVPRRANRPREAAEARSRARAELRPIWGALDLDDPPAVVLCGAARARAAWCWLTTTAPTAGRLRRWCRAPRARRRARRKCGSDRVLFAEELRRRSRCARESSASRLLARHSSRTPSWGVAARRRHEPAQRRSIAPRIGCTASGRSSRTGCKRCATIRNARARR